MEHAKKNESKLMTISIRVNKETDTVIRQLAVEWEKRVSEAYREILKIGLEELLKNPKNIKALKTKNAMIEKLWCLLELISKTEASKNGKVKGKKTQRCLKKATQSMSKKIGDGPKKQKKTRKTNKGKPGDFQEDDLFP